MKFFLIVFSLFFFSLKAEDNKISSSFAKISKHYTKELIKKSVQDKFIAKIFQYDPRLLDFTAEVMTDPQAVKGLAQIPVNFISWYYFFLFFLGLMLLFWLLFLFISNEKSFIAKVFIYLSLKIVHFFCITLLFIALFMNELKPTLEIAKSIFIK